MLFRSSHVSFTRDSDRGRSLRVAASWAARGITRVPTTMEGSDFPPARRRKAPPRGSPRFLTARLVPALVSDPGPVDGTDRDAPPTVAFPVFDPVRRMPLLISGLNPFACARADTIPSSSFDDRVTAPAVE